MSKQYRIAINMTQETGGKVDHNTLVEEFSDDPAIHLLKTKVLTKCFTKALADATEEMADMGIQYLGGKKK